MTTRTTTTILIAAGLVLLGAALTARAHNKSSVQVR